MGESDQQLSSGRPSEAFQTQVCDAELSQDPKFWPSSLSDLNSKSLI